jgi:acetoin utilization deacetylase AcuC-like enzyme
MEHVAIAFDERLKAHDTGPNHPERPARLDAVRAGLEASGLMAGCRRIAAEPLDLDAIHRLHAPDYVTRAREACAAGEPFIDTPDSMICPASFELARLAAGLVVETACSVARGEARRGFAAVRPPGHHAEASHSMGFCLFNNIALAADRLRYEFGMERVLIVDWDVHHGNATQHMFEADPEVFFISLHEHPDVQYPGTGYAYETGVGRGQGFTLNIPFRSGASDGDYEEAFRTLVLPRAETYRPQMVLISAGFDAHHDDPLGHVSLSDDAFVWMLRRLIELAERHCDGRLASVLEGGYHLDVLRRCVHDHVLTLDHG